MCLLRRHALNHAKSPLKYVVRAAPLEVGFRATPRTRYLEFDAKPPEQARTAVAFLKCLVRPSSRLALPNTQRQDCPRCKHRVYHPDWPQDVKQLEKAWANRQAKRREVSEVRDFFTVDEKFQAGAGRGDDFGAFT